MITYGIRDGGSPVGVLKVEDGDVRIEGWVLKDDTIPQEIENIEDLETIEGVEPMDSPFTEESLTEPEGYAPASDQELADAAVTYLQQNGFNVVSD